MLVYTGVTKITLPDGSEEERQNQCIAFGDGQDYVKHENNPVVTGDMLPENCSRIDFRDPKIWKDDGHILSDSRKQGVKTMSDR